jgi:hypothetical protein
VYSIETLPETLSFPSDSTGDLSSPLLSYANGGNYKPYGHRQVDLYHGKVYGSKNVQYCMFSYGLGWFVDLGTDKQHGQK